MMETQLNGFDAFWAIYPRHVAKQTAVKAYKRALKLAAPEVIIRGAERYARERSSEDSKFTKHPATWLNGGCWEDEAQANGKPRSILAAFDKLESILDSSAGADSLFSVPQRRLCGP